MEFALAMLLRPLFMLALFAVVVIPLEMLLSRLIPECRLKVILFDRTFRDRRPVVFTTFVVLSYVLLGAVVYASINYSWPA